jgi:hypothetical protein
MIRSFTSLKEIQNSGDSWSHCRPSGLAGRADCSSRQSEGVLFAGVIYICLAFGEVLKALSG